MPPAVARCGSYAEFGEALNRSRPHRERAKDSELMSNQERKHRSTIFFDVYEALSHMRADVLVTHEAPSVHPYGFTAVDELARAMGVKALFHGHHHDNRDYRPDWPALRFRAYGVGFCGITALDGRVITPGDFD